jgi:hypothetical protein
MRRTTIILLLAAPVLWACEVRETGARNETALAGLPLTDASRAELARIFAAEDDPEVRRACSDAEIAFLEASLLGLAVYTDEARTQPWTASEQEAVDVLMQRWNSLGGDAGTVSEACMAAIDRRVTK